MKEQGSSSVNEKDHQRWVGVGWAVALQECFELAEVEDGGELEFGNDQAVPG
jgi:hypothetical protein